MRIVAWAVVFWDDVEFPFISAMFADGVIVVHRFSN